MTISPRRRVPTWVYALAFVGIAIGAASFALVASTANPAHAWQALLVNFLMWTSLAQGAVAWAAIFRVSRTTWSAPVARLGHAASWFLPFSLVTFGALFVGRQHWLPWIYQDLGDRALWLNVPFMFARDGMGLLVMCAISLIYVRTYLRLDMAHDDQRPGSGADATALTVADARVDCRPRGLSFATSIGSRAQCARPAERADDESGRTDRRLAVLSVTLLVLYAIVYTMLGFDLVMSLDPKWYSALLGAYFAVGGLYAAMAALVVMAVVLRRWLGTTELLGRGQFQDLGNLLMAFAMLMTYLFFSQALVIWYENLPQETSFALAVVNYLPWRTLAWVILFGCYLGPFALLVVREMKENPRTLCGVAVLVLAAMWLERYVLVAPMLEQFPGFGVVNEIPSQPTAAPPQPVWSSLAGLVALEGLGFIGVFALTTAAFLRRYPSASGLDLALAEERERLWP